MFIENINTKVRELSSVNQWQDSDAVINWFKNIKNKSTTFYPLISKDLLLKAIDYAKRFVNINNDEIKTIMHSRKSLLFSGTDVWIKNDGVKDFDLTMGSFDREETFKVVGVEFKWKTKEKNNTKNRKLKQKINNNHSLLRLHNTAFDAIFVQVIFSMLGASSYNFENKGKYNLHLWSTEGQLLIIYVKIFLS